MPRTSRRLTPRSGPKVPSHKFDEPGRYVVYSTPKFLITTAKGQELVSCPSRMVIETGRSRTMKSGIAQVSLVLHEWEAVGTSRLLKGEMRHTMVKPIRCFVRGGSKFADLPGQMSIKLLFETRFRGKLVQSKREGMAVGNISSFPPRRGDIFDISSKKFKVGAVLVEGVQCACAEVA
jgi:hypothetical protein